MNLIKNIIFFLLLASILSSCSSIKSGLTGQAKKGSDEFLVKKKNPLVMPPDFDDLPTPDTIDEVDDEDYSIEKLLGKKSNKNNNAVKSKKSKNSVEKSILKKLNKN